MAVDTRNKRASVVAFGLPFGRVFPAPDGTIATADRKHIGLSYPGIEATEGSGGLGTSRKDFLRGTVFGMIRR